MRYDYWHGPDEEDRRIKYAKSFKPEYQENGDDTQRRIGAVVIAFEADTSIKLPEGYSSGWRPDAVNEITSNAGKKSNHLTADGGDKRDNVDGAFAWWCYRNKGVLEQHGLWMEHPVATVVRAWETAKKQERDPTPWCHLQRVPPGSGARIYYPDTRSVQEWNALIAAGGSDNMSHAAWLAMMKPKRRRDAENSA